jgi:hypothetical protein
MSAETADIVGKTGSEFKFTLSPDDPQARTGRIVKATLKASGQADSDLPFSAHEVTLKKPNKLPAGDSLVVLSIIWEPGDSDAVIDVGSVISGSADAADPKHFIQVDDVPGFVQLFGK